MTFQIFATVFIVAAMLLVLITPTKFGIWSTYEVRSGDNADFVFIQRYHVFGVRWRKVWYGRQANNRRLGVWVSWYDEAMKPVNEWEAKRLTRLTREAMK